MLICAHQPVYLPSLHLLNKIALSDGLVLLGHCQFVKQSWQVRNNIRAGKNPLTLTVPVVKSKSHGQSIKDVLIVQNNWKRKQLRSIQESYSKRPYFDDYFPAIQDIIETPHTNLITLNNQLLLQLMTWLDLNPKVYFSEEYEISGNKTDMLIEICKLFDADQYVSNEGAKAYLEEDKFKQNEIKHYWQAFSHPQYDQGKDFIANLSTIDALFNVGPLCQEMVRDAGHLATSI